MWFLNLFYNFSLQTRLCYTILVQDAGWLYFLTIISILKTFRNHLTQLTSAKLLWTSCRTTLYPLLGQILIISYTRITTMSFCLSLLLLILCMTSLLDVLSARKQRILFSKYHKKLCLYNHTDFIKMHMHNSWLLGKSDLTIELPSDHFMMPKYLFVFCGTLTLNQICDNRDANTFDFHSFLFGISYQWFGILLRSKCLRDLIPSHFVWIIPSYLFCTLYWTLSLIFLILKLGLNHVLNFTIIPRVQTPLSKFWTSQWAIPGTFL